MKYILAGIIGLGFVVTSETSAFAWGCTAEARDGAYGYSYNYPNKQNAKRRALNECSARTDRRCRITYCDPDG